MSQTFRINCKISRSQPRPQRPGNAQVRTEKKDHGIIPFLSQMLKISSIFCGLILVLAWTSKGVFFQKVKCVFSNLPISPQKLFKKTILSLKFEIPAHISKQLQIQISNSGQFFGIFCFWRLGDLKNQFLKKATFRSPG